MIKITYTAMYNILPVFLCVSVVIAQTLGVALPRRDGSRAVALHKEVKDNSTNYDDFLQFLAPLTDFFANLNKTREEIMRRRDKLIGDLEVDSSREHRACDINPRQAELGRDNKPDKTYDRNDEVEWETETLLARPEDPEAIKRRLDLYFGRDRRRGQAGRRYVGSEQERTRKYYDFDRPGYNDGGRGDEFENGREFRRERERELDRGGRRRYRY